jgi:hypothetical protein
VEAEVQGSSRRRAEAKRKGAEAKKGRAEGYGLAGRPRVCQRRGPRG